LFDINKKPKSVFQMRFPENNVDFATSRSDVKIGLDRTHRNKL